MTHIELRSWRKAHGWTQTEAAYYLGTTKTTVHRWELAPGKPQAAPVPTTVALLAHLLSEKKNIRCVEKYLDT